MPLVLTPPRWHARTCSLCTQSSYLGCVLWQRLMFTQSWCIVLAYTIPHHYLDEDLCKEGCVKRRVRCWQVCPPLPMHHSPLTFPGASCLHTLTPGCPKPCICTTPPCLCTMPPSMHYPPWCRYIEELLAKEGAAGVPSSRVVIAGFSQGGAVALLMLRSEKKLAGVVGEWALVIPL